MRTLRAMPPPPSDTGSRQRGRVLLVDDDDVLRQAYARILRRDGFFVDEAANAGDATHAISAGFFDVVISDIGLPDVSGVDLVRALRVATPEVPVVLMTGAADLPTAIAAVDVGAMRYLTKPVDRSVLGAAADDGVVRHQRMVRESRVIRLHALQREEEREAIDHIERAVASLTMAYQPIVRYSTHEVLAYEALVRPRDELLSTPPLLFRAAKQTRRIHDIGRVVRARVARTLDEVSGNVFVNLHPEDLLDPELFEPEAPLAHHAARVTLEITESESLDDVAELSNRIELLRSLGYRIALDDLGTGYAGLAAFADLRPDVVKLAMSFTHGIAKDPRKAHLVRSVVELCKDTSTLLVAEGIETKAELDAMRSLGCDVFQGWLFARPAAEFPDVDWRSVGASDADVDVDADADAD